MATQFDVIFVPAQAILHFARKKFLFAKTASIGKQNEEKRLEILINIKAASYLGTEQKLLVLSDITFSFHTVPNSRFISESL